MVWIYHTFSDSYVYEILGMQSENPTLEETGKASSRHSWFKCLQARQKLGIMIPQRPRPATPSKAKGEVKREKNTSSVGEKTLQPGTNPKKINRASRASERQTTVGPDCRHSAKMKKN